MKNKFLWTVALSAGIFTSSVQAGWHFGTGFGVTQQQGDLSFKTQDSAQQEASFIGDVEVNASDLTKSLLSLDGYGTNGRWRVDYRILPNKLSQTTEDDSFSFESLLGEFSFGRRIVKFSGGKNVFVNFGARYNKQDFTLETTNEQINIDSSWLDAIIGLKADIPVSNNLIIHAGADAGFGGAETSYNAYLMLNYRFNRKWSLALKAEKQNLEYEHNQLNQVDNGKPDWFLSEFDSQSASLRLIRIW